MKKSLMVVLVLVFGVVLLAPFGLGFIADKRFTGLLDKLADSGMVDYTVLRTERGWFSSEMDVVMEISGEMAEAYTKYRKEEGKPITANPGVILKSRLYHGPVAVASFPGMGSSFTPVISRIDTDVYVDTGEGGDSEPLPFDIETLFSLTGGGITHLSMESWKGDVDDGAAQMQWDGINGQIVFSDGFDETAIDLVAPLFSVVGDDGVVKVQDMSLNTDTYLGPQEIELGKATIAVGQMGFRETAGKVNVSIDGMSMAADSSASGELVNTTVSMNIGIIDVAGMKYGPGVMAMELNNLDAASVVKIQKQMKELRRSNMPEEQLSMMMGSTMLSVLPDMLKQAPELIITDLSLDSPHGKFTMTGSIRIDASNEMAMANPLLLAEAVIADLRMSMPEALLVAIKKHEVQNELEAENLEHTPEMLDEMARNRVTMNMSPLVSQGMLVYVDNEYTMNMSFESGRLELNGQEIPIAALMSGMQGGGAQ